MGYLLFMGSCESFDWPPNRNTANPGDTLWIHDLPGTDSLFIDHSLAIGTDGSVYYAAGGGTVHWTASRIHAINKSDGSLKWRSGTLDHMGLSSEIVVGDDGTIYVIGFYTLYAIDPANGSFKWTWEVPETLPAPDGNGRVFTKGQIGALALTDDGDLALGSVGSGVYSRALYLVSKSGTMVWANLNANGGAIYTGISIGKNNTAFYLTTLLFGDAFKYAVAAADLSSGSIKWKTEIKSAGTGLNNIAINDDGTLCVAFSKPDENEIVLHKLDPGNGQIIWSGQEAVYPTSKLFDPSGQIILLDGGFRTFDGSGVETHFQPGQFGSFDAKGRMVGSGSIDRIPLMFCYTTSGILDFSVGMAGLMGFEMVISTDKVVYGIINLHPVSRIPTQICAIQSDSPLSGSNWPRLGHDNRNTSNINKN